MSIFISHSSRDRKVTEAVCAALEARGLRCWMSHRDVQPGDNFQQSIATAIRNCKIMILIFTQNANESSEIAKEIALAGQNKLIVIPLRFEDVAPSLAFAYELSTRQWIDMFHNWEEGIHRLVDQLNLILPEAERVVEPTAASKPQKKSAASLTRPLLGGGFALALLLAGFLTWRHSQPALPPHLSIVVLPFSNISGDPGQDYVADVITDDVTVELSRIKGSFVIGRGTAFSFKGKPLDLKAIAKELNVRYILQGTAAKTDNNFHVNVALIDGLTGANIWADTIDHTVSKVDDVKRDVVFHLASALNLQLIAAESKKATIAKDPDAIDLTMRALANYNQAQNRVTSEILDLTGKALAIQPNYEPALVLRALAKADSYAQRGEESSAPLLAEAEQDALKAIELDPTDATAHYTLAEVKRFKHQINEAILSNNRALELNPNDAESVGLQARLFIEDGKSALAIKEAETAIFLSPRDTNLFTFLWAECNAYVHLAKFQEALPICEKTWGIAQLWFNATALIDIYVALGDTKKAEATKEILLKKYPNFSVTFYPGFPR